MILASDKSMHTPRTLATLRKPAPFSSDTPHPKKIEESHDYEAGVLALYLILYHKEIIKVYTPMKPQEFDSKIPNRVDCTAKCLHCSSSSKRENLCSQTLQVGSSQDSRYKDKNLPRHRLRPPTACKLFLKSTAFATKLGDLPLAPHSFNLCTTPEAIVFNTMD